jgi:hypothetical protein
MSLKHAYDVIGDHAVPGNGFGVSFLLVEECTCTSKGGNHREPQMLATAQLV